MDLALELGKTVSALKAEMTTAELGMWSVYRAKKMLPTRRLEVYLARIAQVTAGGKLEDFLLDFREPQQPTAQTAAESIGALAGGRRVIRIQRKKG